MSKSKIHKRITISLTKEQAEIIELYSEVLEKPQNAVIGDILDEAIPSLKKLLKHFSEAKEGKISPLQMAIRVFTDSFKGLSEASSELGKEIEKKIDEK